MYRVIWFIAASSVVCSEKGETEQKGGQSAFTLSKPMESRNDTKSGIGSNLTDVSRLEAKLVCITTMKGCGAVIASRPRIRAKTFGPRFLSKGNGLALFQMLTPA